MVDVKQWLSDEEVASLTARSDLQGLILLTYNWIAIAAVFCVVSYWHNPLGWFLGVLLLGGRQLGLDFHACSRARDAIPKTWA